MTKKYVFRSLGFLGQMYDEAGEEVNFPSGTEFYLASTAEPTCEHPVRAGVSNGKGMIVDVECGKCHEKLPDQPYTPL